MLAVTSCPVVTASAALACAAFRMSGRLPRSATGAAKKQHGELVSGLGAQRWRLVDYLPDVILGANGLDLTVDLGGVSAWAPADQVALL
jgi:hypothetical protein